MKITLAVDDEVIRAARERAKFLGTSVNQLVRDYLNHLAGSGEAEFERLLYASTACPKAWTFDREELHERR